jgi:hypothetical protein
VSLSATSVEPLGAPPVTAPAGIAGLGAALPDSTLPPIAGISASLTRRMRHATSEHVLPPRVRRALARAHRN